MLIDKGAVINKAKNDGATPFFIACQFGHSDIVQVLIDKGADIKKTWNGITPLQIAKQENHHDVVKLFNKI